MKKFKLLFFMSGLITFLTSYSYGQGCSDAGFCTIDSFKPESGDSVASMNNQLKVGAFYGSADNSIAVYGSYFEYNRQINDKFGFDVKLTSIAQNGNDISVFGLSDVFLSAKYKTAKKVNFTFGTKIPLSNADRSKDNLPLPMDYQASLGTVDIILGIGYTFKNIQLVAAIQQPVTQNSNEFLSSLYPEDSELSKFQSTNKFKRSGDVLLRVSYPISVNKKLKLTPSILPIYHLANDKYTDEAGVEKEIIGSEGLTLNGNVYIDYQINQTNSIQVNMAMPFIVRDVRPDGLTRSFVANLEYRIRF
jgi:hypothetical protein